MSTDTSKSIPGGAAAAFEAGMRAWRTQKMERARYAIAKAALIAPDDPVIALAHARVEHATWRDATAVFERARALGGNDVSAVPGLAEAMALNGRRKDAEALLAEAVTNRPDWIAGHVQLAGLRAGHHGDGFDRSFAAACRTDPDNLGLRLAWFHVLTKARRWNAARQVVWDGAAALGPLRAFDIATAFLASESDEASRDPAILDVVADIDDVGLDLCRVRFWLRIGRPEQAAAIAENRIGHAGRVFWPYLALASRQIDGVRAGWLDQVPAAIASHDLGLSATDLARLATVLRGLLDDGVTLHGQSLRAGVQTERNLFFHPSPIIQAVRERVAAALRRYVDALPKSIADHPLLGPPRGDVLFDGAWAVLLARMGHHVSHTHVRGWISSALHVTVNSDVDGDGYGEGEGAHAGWLAFGRPPTELGIDLPPTRLVRPEPGRLVLFPSTEWHATEPFDVGDRMTIAFDVAIPRPV